MEGFKKGLPICGCPALAATANFWGTAGTSSNRLWVPQPLIEDILCVRLWAQFLPSRKMLSGGRDP